MTTGRTESSCGPHASILNLAVSRNSRFQTTTQLHFGQHNQWKPSNWLNTRPEPAPLGIPSLPPRVRMWSKQAERDVLRQDQRYREEVRQGATNANAHDLPRARASCSRCLSCCWFHTNPHDAAEGERGRRRDRSPLSYRANGRTGLGIDTKSAMPSTNNGTSAMS